ncbi:methyl-accepting chemotaxis protein [Paenibacillus sp. J2TS4]|uniref:methyl-accepting chemotaxis protein n=1 Tax=Paenibacillus sp. J2TS4 TaxID=2807194 RepID=UPI001B06898C|nr:methyl-accepting chemotaxis protein [Paenibacillus sp. J2TS4]GIP36184.1 hypothetical protein J2TS4_53940 [Paenibacillus sp. J2TS4]
MALLKKNRSYEIKPIAPSDIPGTDKLRQKLFYLQVTENDLHHIHKLQSVMDKHAETITRRHYELLFQIDEMKHIIDCHSTKERLTQTFIAYLKSIPRVEMDDTYIQNRKKVGIVHSRIQLSPEWFIGAFMRIYEYMIPNIMEMYSKRQEATEILISLQKILTLDALIVLEAYQEAHEFKFIETNSQIIEQIIQMDKVHPLLEGVEATIQEAMSVSAAAEELSASVDDVANHAVQVAENTEDLITQAHKGQEIINESLQGFLGIAGQFSETRDRFTELFQAIENVTKVTQLIRDVADQTNLLALNAAIEAARAGEQGLGFAVVADEVRKLSDQTKQSVESISAMIQEVRKSAMDVGDQADRMSDDIVERVEQTKHAIHSLDEIMNQVSQIGTSTGNIAAIVEEQSAATHEISFRISEVLKQTEQVKENAVDTGQDIYKVSRKVNELRQQSLNYFSHMSNGQLIRVVKTDHLLWKWWVYNRLLGYHEMDTEAVADFHICRLGKWYDENRSRSQVASLPSFAALDQPHQQVHSLAATANRWIEQGDYKEAMRTLDLIGKASQEVVGLLENLQKDLERQHV